MKPIGYRLHGTGQQGVIVLHGGAIDSTAFEPMLPFLDADYFSYAFMDARGFGNSRQWGGPYTLKEIAADAVNLADHLGWQRFHLVGHSMGGKALLRLFVDEPRRIASGVAITPIPATAVELGDELGALYQSAPENDESSRILFDLCTGQRLGRTWLDWLVRQMRKSVAPEVLACYLQDLFNTEFAAELEGCALPLLLCVGEHDLLVTADALAQTGLTGLLGAELQVIPNSGHCPMLETPVYLATLIESFLRNHAH